MTVTSERPTVACGCELASHVNAGLAARGTLESHAELHALLAGIENAGPVDAARVMVQIVGDEMWGIEPNDLMLFAAQHTWRDPVAVGDMFSWVACTLRHLHPNQYGY